MQFDRQQNSALYSEFSRIYVEICRLETLLKSGKRTTVSVVYEA